MICAQRSGLNLTGSQSSGIQTIKQTIIESPGSFALERCLVCTYTCYIHSCLISVLTGLFVSVFGPPEINPKLVSILGTPNPGFRTLPGIEPTPISWKTFPRPWKNNPPTRTKRKLPDHGETPGPWTPRFLVELGVWRCTSFQYIETWEHWNDATPISTHYYDSHFSFQSDIV